MGALVGALAGVGVAGPENGASDCTRETSVDVPGDWARAYYRWLRCYCSGRVGGRVVGRVGGALLGASVGALTVALTTT